MTNKQKPYPKTSRNLFVKIPIVFFIILGSVILFFQWQQCGQQKIEKLAEKYERKVLSPYFKLILEKNFAQAYHKFWHPKLKKKISLKSYLRAYENSNRGIFVSYTFVRKQVTKTPQGLILRYYLKFKNNNPRSVMYGKETFHSVFFELATVSGDVKILRVFTANTTSMQVKTLNAIY